MEGALKIVGMAAGALLVKDRNIANDIAVRSPYWGWRTEFLEVLETACPGAINVGLETSRHGGGPVSYERMHGGEIRHRGVILPLPWPIPRFRRTPGSSGSVWNLSEPP